MSLHLFGSSYGTDELFVLLSPVAIQALVHFSRGRSAGALPEFADERLRFCALLKWCLMLLIDYDKNQLQHNY